MTGAVGYASLLAALVLALWGSAAPLLGARTGRRGFFASARAAIVGQFVLVTVASLTLIYALMTTDFSIKYVAFNTTRATPIYYRVTGLWGALEGSLPPNAVLYIIARQGDGPPLAVKRIPKPTFPLSFGLSEEDRMVGRRPFEGEVMVVARLKRDGMAGPPGPGDIEGRAKRPVKIGQRGVDVVLDTAY